jgi:hypothetical protein
MEEQLLLNESVELLLGRKAFRDVPPQGLELLAARILEVAQIPRVHLGVAAELPEVGIDQGRVERGSRCRDSRCPPRWS